MYSRFYHLHIPKTGGTFFEKNIKSQMLSAFDANQIITDVEDQNRSQHLCWYKPYIQDSTYIFSIMREPISRLISQYAWQAKLAVDQGITNHTYDDITKNNFFQWVDKHYDIYKNYQLKNLTYYNPDSDYKRGTHLGWDDVPRISSDVFDHFGLFNPNIKDVIINLDRINYIVKSKDLLDVKKQSIIIDKLHSDLGINGNIVVGNLYANQNEISSMIKNSLNSHEKSLLSEYLNDEIIVYHSLVI